MAAAVLLDGPALRRWTELSARALGDARTAIDAINVFPVPDGDTGTNLYLTVVACAEAVAGLPGDADHTRVWATLTDTAMRNARGNSGVLWSQALRGLAEVLRTERTDGPALCDALRRAAALARAAVQRPVEGTLLTVLDAAATAALTAAGNARPDGARPEGPRPELGGAALEGSRPESGRVVAVGSRAAAEFAVAAADAAWAALDATPGQLRALAEGGVVDAGAAGLCLLLDALAAVTSGRTVRRLDLPTRPAGAPHAAPAVQEFEVMFLLDSDPGRVADLRAALDAIGDSLMITGGDGTWQVHVHTDDAGAAIERGVRAGHAYRFRVSCLRPHPSGARPGRGVIALAGPGLAGLFPYDDTTALDGPSAEVLVAEIGSRAEVAVVPGSPESYALARTAIADAGADAVLVPADAAVRQVAAFAVHDPGRPFTDDAAAMAEAARAVRAGRLSHDGAGYHASGDGVGATSGPDPEALAVALATALLAAGGELLTIIDGTPDALGTRVETAVTSTHPEVTTAVHPDPTLGHPLELGVE